LGCIFFANVGLKENMQRLFWLLQEILDFMAKLLGSLWAIFHWEKIDPIPGLWGWMKGAPQFFILIWLSF
jgi:hypothetical protein